jgi:hypothetical protein
MRAFILSMVGWRSLPAFWSLARRPVYMALAAVLPFMTLISVAAVPREKALLSLPWGPPRT